MSNIDINTVPHLTTSLKGPISQIERDLLSKQALIESWMKEQLNNASPPIYCSVDLRNSGFKIAPVDTNLFPAGFNNLNADFLPLCIQAVQAALHQNSPKVEKILLIPEDHTRNIYYYENIAIISEIFIKAGFELRVGTLLTDLKRPRNIDLPSGKHVTLEPVSKENGRLEIGEFLPDLILLNNDLSAGIPELLQGVEQPIMPPLSAGWYSRLKSTHFRHYKNVVTEFGEQFDIDPWLLSPLFRYCGKVNFMVKDGEHCLVKQADQLLAEIKTKYKQHNIDQKPFLVVKADSGTYGMAVMMIQDASELANLNRKERTRMASIKGGREVTKVIIQEGVHTSETWGDEKASAEPVIYMIGKQVVGGFYRVHSGRSLNENLNAPGMNFEPLAFADEIISSDSKQDENRFYAYSVVGRLALIAATRELEESSKTNIIGESHDN